MASSKTIALMLVLGALALTTVSARSLKQATTAAQVTFFDDSFEGGSQTFAVALPATGCSACTNLNLIRTNSWESFLSSVGTTINLYDGRDCKGTTAAYPARSGVIMGSLANSVDSITLCA